MGDRERRGRGQIRNVYDESTTIAHFRLLGHMEHVHGSPKQDRRTLTWQDKAIVQCWLQGHASAETYVGGGTRNF